MLGLPVTGDDGRRCSGRASKWGRLRVHLPSLHVAFTHTEGGGPFLRNGPQTNDSYSQLADKKFLTRVGTVVFERPRALRIGRVDAGVAVGPPSKRLEAALLLAHGLQPPPFVRMTGPAMVMRAGQRLSESVTMHKVAGAWQQG